MPHSHLSFKKKYLFSLKAKGNISLLVILILLASSLLSLLAMLQLRNMMVHGSLTYNYFRAHYIAKAGLELALTEISTRGVGFQKTILSGDAIAIGNFAGYENREPYFSVEMKAMSNNVWESVKLECDPNSNTYVGWKNLDRGDSIVIPLFYDNVNVNASHREILLGKMDHQHILLASDTQRFSLKLSKPDNLFIFGLFAFSDENLMDFMDMVTREWRTNQDLSNFLGEKSFLYDGKSFVDYYKDAFKYLTIVNVGNPNVKVCINSQVKLPIPDTLINVKAHYGDVEVGLRAVFSEPFPSFLQDIVVVN